MDTDDLEPTKPNPLEPANLEEMSIEALRDYIAERETEIDRARAMIARKDTARNVADAVFKR